MKQVREVRPVGIDDAWRFDVIHVTGLTSLSISVICCVIVLLFIARDAKIGSVRAFFARPVGERLLVYLALCNLLYNLSHIMDHAYMLAVRGNPPDATCAAFGFFLNQFVVAQALIVTFTAVNAFVMVVKKTKVTLGRYDWKLFLVSLGVPLVCGTLLAATRHLGPSGMWSVSTVFALVISNAQQLIRVLYG